MRNSLSFLLLAAALVFSEKSAPDSAVNKNFSLGISFDFLRFSIGESALVRNVPYDFRNVPVHSDDSVFKNNSGPIARQNYELNGCYEFAFLLHCSFKIWIPVEASLGFCLPVAGDIAERNYTNDVGGVDRSKDAALTYCRFSKIGTAPLIGLELPRLRSFTSFERYGDISITSLMIGLGCDLSYQTLTVENGWDRFSKYQVYQEKTLAYFVPINSYMKLSFVFGTNSFLWRFALKTGATFNNFYFPTADGREMGVGVKTASWFFSLTFLDFAYYFF